MLVFIDKAMQSKQQLEIIYMSNSGQITKRRIKVLAVYMDSFIAYCFFRRSTRTFKFNNVLAIVPVVRKESVVI